MSGIQDVDRKLVEVGRMYRMNGLKLVRRVLLPATLPAYVVGLRSGLGLGWMFVVAAEYMGASRSEEHTSELQSLMRISYAVFCLKKTTKPTNPYTTVVNQTRPLNKK